MTTIEKDLFSFFALFAALFSIKVFSGFFFSCFLLSWPLPMIATPYIVSEVDKISDKRIVYRLLFDNRAVVCRLSDYKRGIN